MSKQIDMSKPLSAEDQAYLRDRARLPEEYRSNVQAPQSPAANALRTQAEASVAAVKAAEEAFNPDDETFSEYGDLTVADLQEELEKRELPKSGTKAELIARLEEDDESSDGGE